MDTNKRIQMLMEERGWTEYRLAKNAGLSQSTVINLFHRNTVPSIATLTAICNAFGITLSDFFREEAEPREPNELLTLWEQLNDEQQNTVLRLLQYIKPLG